MQKISTCLWFDDQAEAAADFYTSIFKNSKILGRTRYSKSSEEVTGKLAGTTMTVVFELNGHEFIALNGGPHFKFSESVSIVVNCESQSEVDEYWEKLSQGGQTIECGWLRDKFGLSWQIVPSILTRLLQDRNPEKVNRVMGAMLQMKKLNIDELKRSAA